ncbi:hypothetical protein [Blastomonas sp.]|uniref:hypothetical protein n=1 Tax=Blastomonas sp. TaxID=1909299 RepID=UPI00261C0518|nr:hypothetical protein [Blastomonas sp.]MDM7956560.1 hypothetical protein [Blastomonas sp.]
MKNRIAAAALAALAITATPVLAQAGAERISAVSAEENEAEGGTGIIIGVLAAAAVIGGIVIAADQDSDTPTSP